MSDAPAPTPPGAAGLPPELEAQRAPYAQMRRTHAFTLGHRLLTSLPGLLYALLPILIASGSGGWQSWFTLVAVVGYGVLAVPAIAASWLRFTFRVDPDAVVIESGIFARQFRNIPVERIQRIEIEQPAVARAFGMARILLLTGSGAGAEGTISFIPHAEALGLRRLIRALEERAAPTRPAGDADEQQADEPADQTLFEMPLGLVLGKGALRFSLVYIAIAFGLVQNLQINPDDVVDFFTSQRYSDYTSALPTSPWITAALSVGVALLLSWLFGILTTLNTYYGFRLIREKATKLVATRGLLGRVQQTVPVERVQALLMRSNPAQRRLGYGQFYAQTMGLDQQASGLSVLVPFARAGVSDALAGRLFGVARPPIVRHVSELFVRRRVLRVVLWIGLPVAAVYALTRSHHAFWPLLLVPVLILWVRRLWQVHGYALDRGVLTIRAGAILRRLRFLPAHRIQAIDLEQSFFQRRRGLASVVVDTAGAQQVFTPCIHDLPLDEALALVARLDPLILLRRPAHRWQPLDAARAQPDQPEVEHGGDGLAVGRSLEAHGGPPEREGPRGRPGHAQPPGQAGGEGAEERAGRPPADVPGNGAQDDAPDQPLHDDDVEGRHEDGQREHAR